MVLKKTSALGDVTLRAGVLTWRAAASMHG
jgi:hypothetical protein